MHPDAVQNVTRICNQTWPHQLNNHYELSDHPASRQGDKPGYNFAKKSVTDFQAQSGLNRCSGFLDEFRSNWINFFNTPSFPQNQYPTQRNSLRGFLARKILAYFPLPPRPAVAITSSWSRRVFYHALSLSMIRAWAFPMFSHCSPPHVR